MAVQKPTLCVVAGPNGKLAKQYITDIPEWAQILI